MIEYVLLGVVTLALEGLWSLVVVSDACPRCGGFERYVRKNGDRQCAPCNKAWSARYRAQYAEQDLARHAKYRSEHREQIRAQANAANRDPEVKLKHRAYMRAWTAAHPEEASARGSRYHRLHPEQASKWRRLNPEMGRAGARVYSALKSGKLIRPASCEECGKDCKPEAAHLDYSKPLDVRWLCRSCHRLWDIAEPKSAYSRARRGLTAA